MSNDQEPRKRGRPPSITRERIAEAGLHLGLSDLTFVGVAAGLGVSHMALYKHVAGLDDLRTIVADAIFDRHRLPQPGDAGCDDLKGYLTIFSASLWSLTQANPDLATYLLRFDKITSAMAEKIADHHTRIARAYGLSLANARWLLFTVAYHSVALADMARSPQNSENAPRPDLETGRAGGGFELGMQALIEGVLDLIEREAQSVPQIEHPDQN